MLALGYNEKQSNGMTKYEANDLFDEITLKMRNVQHSKEFNKLLAQRAKLTPFI
jgi:hypothetical protein